MKISKIILAGGSGFIGSYLVEYCQKHQIQVVILTRKYKSNYNNVKYVNWNGINIDLWIEELENTDLLINLTGKNIQCLFTKKNKKELLDSRVNSVNVLSQAIRYVQNPPKLWIQASGLGFYGNTKIPCHEFSEKGSGILSNLTEKWEHTLFKRSLNSTRRIVLRFGLALHYSGGILAKLVKFTKNFAGASVGNGEMYISWFHLFDLTRIIEFLFENPSLEGTFNVCTPNPITNKIFMQKLRNYFDTPYIPPVPEFIFKLISKNLINIEPELILNSQQVIPKRLLELGFKFTFDNLQSVLFDLYPKQNKAFVSLV